MQDALAIEKLQAIPKQVLPVLEREYEDIMRELAQQQAEVAEIESSDQEYLNELKASIAEQKCVHRLEISDQATYFLQSVVVEAYQAEVAESNAQLEWLQERLQELDLEKRQARTAIADANRILHIQKNSTHAELFRLNRMFFSPLFSTCKSDCAFRGAQRPTRLAHVPGDKSAS
jgi:kinetochore protein Spc7/SPC105